jgi:hypothetical protein
VCEMVWCGGGEGVIRTSHPALEGSACGSGRWCRDGHCVAVSDVTGVRAVDGGWGEWNDAPARACGGECSACEIEGQYSTRRSLRLCDTPAYVMCMCTRAHVAERTTVAKRVRARVHADSSARKRLAVA